MKRNKGFTPLEADSSKEIVALSDVKSKRWFLTGFTLLELIVVLVIVGILSAIAIPTFTNAVNQQRANSCANNMKIIFAAWRLYDLNNAPLNTTLYDSKGVWTVKQLNDTLGIMIDERNFGYPTPATPGFVLIKNSDNLQLFSNRNQGSVINSVSCKYYFDRSSPATVYDYSSSSFTPKPNCG